MYKWRKTNVSLMEFVHLDLVQCGLSEQSGKLNHCERGKGAELPGWATQMTLSSSDRPIVILGNNQTAIKTL